MSLTPNTNTTCPTASCLWLTLATADLAGGNRPAPGQPVLVKELYTGTIFEAVEREGRFFTKLPSSRGSLEEEVHATHWRPRPGECVPVRYASPYQKESIIRLLNHPTITRQIKTKHLLAINRMDEAEAWRVLEALRAAVDYAENVDEVEGLRRALLRFAQDHSEALEPADRRALQDAADNPKLNAGRLREMLRNAHEWVKQQAAIA